MIVRIDFRVGYDPSFISNLFTPLLLSPLSEISIYESSLEPRNLPRHLASIYIHTYLFIYLSLFNDVIDRVTQRTYHVLCLHPCMPLLFFCFILSDSICSLRSSREGERERKKDLFL